MDFPTRYTAQFRDIPGLCNVDCSMTKQAFKNECDINLIMRKYTQSGVLPASVSNQRFDDFSEVGDYLEAQTVLLDARAQFDALPAVVRDRFRNNPLDMLAFVQDPVNSDEAIKLGIVVPKPVVPAVVSVAPPVAPVVAEVK
jgi:phage internal scaffolding protein